MLTQLEIMKHSEYLKKEAKAYNLKLNAEIKAMQGGINATGLSKAHKQMAKLLNAVDLVNNGQSAIVSESMINIIVNNCKSPSKVNITQLEGTKMFKLSIYHEKSISHKITD